MTPGHVSGIEQHTVVPWLEVHVGLRPPVSFTLVPGGRSNLTYLVDDDAGCRVVLRRPPLGMVLASAHDMGREHRILTGLSGTDVPVPRPLAYCEDEAVNGAPFYVMAYVAGHVVRDRVAAETLLGAAARRRAGASLVDVLAAIHAVDPDAVGLGELGRREGYLARQLTRWHGQLEHATSEVPVQLHEVHDGLVTSMPEQGAVAIVHGDYRLDNCILDDEAAVVAVLDWELCTLGDPLADLGTLLMYWREPEDDDLVEDGVGYPSSAPGFVRRAELVERYADVSGRDVSRISYYEAFGAWKLACILQGVTDRYRGGAMGDESEVDVDAFAQRVRWMAGRAAELLA